MELTYCVRRKTISKASEQGLFERALGALERGVLTCYLFCVVASLELLHACTCLLFPINILMYALYSVKKGIIELYYSYHKGFQIYRTRKGVKNSILGSIYYGLGL